MSLSFLSLAPAILVLWVVPAILVYRKNIFFQTRSGMSDSLVGVMVGFWVCSALELFGYQNRGQIEVLELPLRIYYVSLGVVLALLVQLAICTITEKVNRWVLWIDLTIFVALCFILVFTDFVVAGVVSIDHTVTRMPGNGYWWVPVYVVTAFLACFITLVYGYVRATELFDRVQTVYIMLGVTCFFAPIIAVLCLMLLGFEINAVIILPVGMLGFLGFVFYTVRNTAVVDPRIMLPFSRQRRLYRMIQAEFYIKRGEGNTSIQEQKKTFEKVVIGQALLNYEGRLKQWEIADKLGLSHSALSKKRKDYGI